MESSVLKRVREIINYFGISDRKFSETINVPQTTISSLFKRGSEPNASILQSILNAYKDISSDWLLMNKGEMIKQITISGNNQGDNSNIVSGISAGSVNINNHNIDQKTMDKKDRMIEQNDSNWKDMYIRKEQQLEMLKEDYACEIADFKKRLNEKDEYIRSYIKDKEQYIERIVNHSYNINQENMQRIDNERSERKALLLEISELRKQNAELINRLLLLISNSSTSVI